ncbi:MAG: PorT family protein [Flavobacteriaceae bacterium]|nr:PorT family protein [Flavobacteriaceae bacterium]
MKKEFENSIKNKLEDFIATNEIAYQPEHWQQLQKKKNAKKRIVFYWRWVAVLLLFLVAGGMVKWFYSSKEIVFFSDENKIVQTDSLNNQIIDKQSDIEIENKEIARNEEQQSIPKKTISKQHFKRSTTKNNFSKLVTQNTENKAVEEEVKLEEKVLKEEIVQKEAVLPKKEDEKTVVSISVKKSKKDDFQNVIEKQKEVEDNVKYREVTIGVDASSMLSYNVDNVRNQLGYSGGVSFEIPLFNKFDLQAGVLYSNQKIDNFTHTNNGVLYADKAVSSPKENRLARRGVQSYHILMPKTDLTSREITVNMIEIPLSLKYHFHLYQQKLFVSAGISASSVLNEKISSQYDVGEKVVSHSFENGTPITTYEYQTSQPKIIEKQNLYRFYPLSAFQFSFGSEFNVGKTQSVVIEPYFKQFIQPITSKKATFTNVGIRLQYRFNLKF